MFPPHWDHPPQYDSMHRPGIASVTGATIVLDGTTLEEVQRHHRDTLKLALQETNKEYRQWLESTRAKQRQRRELEAQHRLDIEERAKGITFD